MEYKFSVIRKSPKHFVYTSYGVLKIPAAQLKLRGLIEKYPPEDFNIFIEVSINVLEHDEVNFEDPEKQMIDLGNKLLSRVSDE